MVLGLFFVLVPLALLLSLTDSFMLDCCHDKVEIALGLAVSNFVEHDLRLDVNSSGFTHEYSLKTLQHLQNVYWVHTSILIVIAQLEHN